MIPKDLELDLPESSEFLRVNNEKKIGLLEPIPNDLKRPESQQLLRTSESLQLT